MYRVRSLCFVSYLLLIAAHRLPAPIVEPEEKPTTPSQESEPPNRKHSTKSKTTPDEQAPIKSETRAKPASPLASQGPTRFAGRWTGKINQGLLGHVRTSLTIDSTATSIALSHNLGGGSRPLTVSGNTASWKTGVVGEIAWTLTPNDGGGTAQVTMKGLLVHDSTTFRRSEVKAPPARSTSTPQ